MVDEKIELTQGGVYLAKLDSAKHVEIGKIRPVIILTSPIILKVSPKIIFTCPLSSHSYSDYTALHVELPPRDNLQRTSFALIEHSRAISIKRIKMPRLAQLTLNEISAILLHLQRLVGLENGIYRSEPSFLKGRIRISEDFDAPLPDELLDLFEGR